jgi:hypothetical protein
MIGVDYRTNSLEILPNKDVDTYNIKKCKGSIARLLRD